MGWYEAIKDAIVVADRLRDIELKQRLADVQVECAKLAEENAKLRQELLDLREQAKTRQ
jgi:predicted ATP-grasp superfamily ATP-dependent carboligase